MSTFWNMELWCGYWSFGKFANPVTWDKLSACTVSASCNIVIYKGVSILRTYTHIYRGFCTVFVTYLSN